MHVARRVAPFASWVVLAAVAAGCAVSARADDPLARAEPPTTTSTLPPTTTTSTTAPVTTTTAAPPVVVVEPRPVAAGDPVYLSEQLLTAELALRDPATPAPQLSAMAHLQQVAYRQLGVHPEWDAEVLARLPVELHRSVQLNAAARREFRGMATKLSDTLPAWRIVEPRPADELLGYYHEAEAATGVPWYYLAAVNLVETGMGRIQGLSTAGAQGPMQFLPSTWARWGQGDINDPHDAILGAARYLAHNGGAAGNIEAALWNYNHHPNYVRGVSYYAEAMATQPQAYYGFHAWRVYYLTVLGDVLLPTGYESATRLPVAEYLATHP